MRKLTKKLAALALGVVTVASLTACGGSSKGITIAVPNDTTNEARPFFYWKRTATSS